MIGHQEIDLQFQGCARAICCHRVGDVIVDPGPSSCSGALLDALGGEQPRAILLTHIHLDHAGAAGSLLAEWPGTELWVHEQGAGHMADPSRLIASATRLYGDRMNVLWGEIAPVPQERMVVLSGGEERDGFAVQYTPGHASHHVSYLHLDSGLALAGDVAGVRIGEGPALPPTPPPDIDIELWERSLDLVRRWRPSALAITHYGTFADVELQLDQLADGLRYWAELALEVDAETFAEGMRKAMDDDPAYLLAMPVEYLHAGLERYWRKRSEQVSSEQ